MRKRHALWLVLAALAIAVPASATVQTYFGFTIGVASAPPPPTVVYMAPPPVVLVPNTDVYVVENPYGYDSFRYGGYWYVCSHNYWYRASSYRGRYTVIDVRSVPHAIFNVPPGQWKHHWKHQGWDRYEVAAHGEGHGEGHGHGHGHGH